MTPHPQHAGHSVLVVEDDVDSAQSFCDLLVAMGYDAVVASNGRVALDVLKADPGRYCMVMLDLMMPVMDGWTFLGEQERDAAIRDIPVVVVSAALDAQQAVRRKGTIAVLPKPLDFGRLQTVLAEHC